jgi:hypothetical protein
MTGQVQGKVASSCVTGTELVIDGGMNAGGAVPRA